MHLHPALESRRGAIAFGMEDLAATGPQARTVLVFDLGGGTFDVSILAMGAGPSSLGPRRQYVLGGDDFIT